MKSIFYITLLLLFLCACSGNDEGDSTNFGNINTLLKQASITNDNEGTRIYTYDSDYKLIKIQNNIKTITFSYYPADEFDYCDLKSIVWQSGATTKKIELSYVEDDLQEIDTMILTADGQVITATGSVYENDWNYLKLDFGSYYELILRGGGGVKEIKKYDTETNQFLVDQSYRFRYYEPGFNVDFVDMGYGRTSDKTWMLMYLDRDEFFKFPISSYAVDYIENFDYENPANYYFRQHSHQFDEEVLVSTKIHEQDNVFHEITYQFEKLPGKVD